MIARSKKELMEQIPEKQPERRKLKALNEKEAERMLDLCASYPLSVKPVDVELARKGWVEQWEEDEYFSVQPSEKSLNVNWKGYVLFNSDGTMKKEFLE